jgi:hypothetical protein
MVVEVAVRDGSIGTLRHTRRSMMRRRDGDNAVGVMTKTDSGTDDAITTSDLETRLFKLFSAPFSSQLRLKTKGKRFRALLRISSE